MSIILNSILENKFGFNLKNTSLNYQGAISPDKYEIDPEESATIAKLLKELVENQEINENIEDPSMEKLFL